MNPRMTKLSFALAKALGLDFLLLIPKFFIFIALTAWIAVMIGLVYHLTSTLIKAPTLKQPAKSSKAVR